MLVNIGALYAPPACRISEMTRGELEAMAMTWADVLGDVPVEAVEELYRRAMRNWTSDFAPSAGTFRKAWNDWDYWAEINAAGAEANEYLALPQAMAATNTPRFVQLFQAYGPVMCNCEETLSPNGKYRYPSMAQLVTVAELQELGRDMDYAGLDYTRRFESKDVPRYWVCATGKCSFCVDANKLDEFLPVKRHRDGDEFSAVAEVMDSLGKAPRVESTAADAVAAEVAPVVPVAEITDAELLEALSDCGFPVAEKGEARSVEFGRYLVSRLGPAGLNATDARTLWPDFRAGLLLRGDGGTSGGGSRAAAVAEVVGR